VLIKGRKSTFKLLIRQWLELLRVYEQEKYFFSVFVLGFLTKGFFFYGKLFDIKFSNIYKSRVWI
jgi:hypothetical protein